MNRFTSSLFRSAAVAAVIAAASGSQAAAQAVIFPQQTQPGLAVLNESDGSYTLSNDILSASFSLRGNTLVFDGCEAMNLLPGTELFSVTLGNGTVVPASEMTMTNLRATNLVGDPGAAKGSERFDGKAIEADFKTGDLNIAWKAVLRDGSHYLRTELLLTGDNDVAMRSITPMIYSVSTSNGVDAPVVVGNTRGAILAGSKIFAGVESPMGINSASNSAPEDFAYSSWTANTFSWTPGSETPRGILDLGYSEQDIVGTRGYLVFREPGENTVTFTYASGTHRLNIVGVDAVDIKSKEVVASDYHFGYTGSAKDKNVYTLNIPAEGAYIVRYFMEIKTETITSSGNIAYNKRVTVPEIIVGDEPETPAKAPARRVLAADAAIDEGGTLADNWTTGMWQQVPETDVPARIVELGHGYPDVKVISRPISIASTGKFTVEFTYRSGNNRLDIVGVDLVDAGGNTVVSDYHFGFSGNAKKDNVYTLELPYAGDFTLRYFCSNRNEANTSGGDINIALTKVFKVYIPAEPVTPIQGVWSRNTTLAQGKTWKTSAVVGIIAPDQARRSVLAYIERERAVPWRPFTMYNSWYELNINRNNDPNYTSNFNINQCVEVLNQWKTNLYDKYDAHIQSFVWDDGWDNYGTWTFNPNFPNGFKEADDVSRAMGSHIGAWLGPVGGYGQSGNYRRNYWNGKGGMQLSNPAYYETFLTACSNMINSYQFNAFKFDGISGQVSSVGPDAGTTGEENAEAIIEIEDRVREIKPDVFLNTTVGTWASPFWFRHTDAVWRQENDYGTIGNQGSDRERWITYRDRLVYQNFVTNSPLCPINTLMTHGVIVSNFGSVSKDMDYDGIVRELRCAFACGSGLVELYCDFALLNSINDGALWADIAECIKWQERNADVLPDAHWVGGNPWTGAKAEVYGWASWNGTKSTLALRNPAANIQRYTFTLREALEIPAHVTGSITLTPSFAVQRNLNGLTVGKPIDIDTPISVTMPSSSVFVFDGLDSAVETGIKEVDTARPAAPANDAIYDLLGRRVNNPGHGIYIINGTKVRL